MNTTLILLILLISLIAIVGTLNIACFFIGAKVGQMVAMKKEITSPTLNPFKIIEERKEQKKADEAEERFNNIMHNIDTYDGTGNGQRKV